MHQTRQKNSKGSSSDYLLFWLGKFLNIKYELVGQLYPYYFVMFALAILPLKIMEKSSFPPCKFCKIVWLPGNSKVKN